MSVPIRFGQFVAALLFVGSVLLLPADTGAASASLAPTRSPQPVAALSNPELLGMAIRDPWYDFGTFPGQPNQPNTVAQDAMGANLAKLGVRWVRLEFHIEGTDALSVTQVARNDYFINTVAPRYNLKVLGLLSFGILRARGPCDLLLTDTLKLDPMYGGGVNDYMRTWLNRARMITDRYGDRVSAYEVLNEQNRLPSPCHPGIEGDAIPATIAARLHTKFYRFFKGKQAPSNQPWRAGVSVILGGLHPAGTSTPGKTGYLTDRQYLQQLYQSDGFQDFYKDNNRYPLDGLGYHPYPDEIRKGIQSDIDLIDGRMDEVRVALSQIAPSPGTPPFWVTEVGLNAGYGKQTFGDQADFLRLVYTALSARGDVATVFWFKYEDFPPDTGPNAQRWGVVHIAFKAGTCPGGACYDPLGVAQPHPSFYVYRELAGLPVYRSLLPLVHK